MWTSFKYTNTTNPLNSPQLPVVRPWTPPESDGDVHPDSHLPNAALDKPDFDTASQTDSGYFGQAVEPSEPSIASSDDMENVPVEELRNRWPLSATPSPNLPTTPVQKPARRAPPPHLHEPNAHTVDPVHRPYTPTKTLIHKNGHPHTHPAPPQYPYTPDSARTTLSRTHTFPTAAPLPPMPWYAANNEANPVQQALLSCLSNLEHLISTSQPTDTQMDYIIAQIEAISSYLSAPDAQSRQTDDVLFEELENVLLDNDDVPSKNGIAELYVLEVGSYIDAVKKNVEDLKTRLEETKQLNEIQLEIISDLRMERRAMERKRVLEENAKKIYKTPSGRRIVTQIPPQRNSFWNALGEALDDFGKAFFEW